MEFVFEGRDFTSPFIERIWRTQTEKSGVFISEAGTQWEMVITTLEGKTAITVRGPETTAWTAPYPADGEFFGITFKLGNFMPKLPVDSLVNSQINLPEAARKAFWMHGTTWELPTFENADVFVARLIRDELLVHDPLIDAARQGQVNSLSDRSVQRRFLRATGLTHGTIYQIERAQSAVKLLEGGLSILDTVEAAGYSDQPHLTRSLKRFVGRTPAEIARAVKAE